MRDTYLDKVLREIPEVYHDDLQDQIIVDPAQLRSIVSDLIQRERLLAQEAHSEVRSQVAKHAFLIGLLFGLTFGVTLGRLL